MSDRTLQKRFSDELLQCLDKIETLRSFESWEGEEDISGALAVLVHFRVPPRRYPTRIGRHSESGRFLIV